MKEDMKSSQGHFLLKALFYETAQDKDTALYTLKDHDITVSGKYYPSMKRLYVYEEDPTEFSFADKYLYSYEHLQRLLDCSWFRPYIQKWREEAEVRIRSKALAAIKKKSEDPSDKDHYQAAKLLLSKGWEVKETQKTGPRTKEKIKKEAQELLRSSKDVDEDFQRLKLVKS